MTVRQISKELQDVADPVIAEHSQRFFKTGKGEYGEGDKFLGIRVPVLRALAKKYKDASIREIQYLLQSKFHEERLFALFLLVQKFNKSNTEDKKIVFNLYLKNTRYINNWDLVDCSAPAIVGGFLENKDRCLLYKLCRSKNLWERRMAVMATFAFIKNNQFSDTLSISELLIGDKEDLIHKAVGWMLREIGNRNPVAEKKFLKVHYKEMPRTMLRYAIEKFPENERLKYLRGVI